MDSKNSIPSTGGGTAEILFQQPGSPYPSSWSRDGSTLAYVATSDSTGADVWLYTPGSTPKTRPLLHARASETSPQISPDGRWMAYASDESGRNEVYLRPFPAGTGKWRLSDGGGSNPKWSPDERKIYYRQKEVLYGVPLSLRAGSVTPGRPERIYVAPGLNDYDVSPDGGSIVINKRIIRKGRRELHVVLNWLAELNAKIPANEK